MRDIRKLLKDLEKEGRCAMCSCLDTSDKGGSVGYCISMGHTTEDEGVHVDVFLCNECLADVLIERLGPTMSRLIKVHGREKAQEFLEDFLEKRKKEQKNERHTRASKED